MTTGILGNFFVRMGGAVFIVVLIGAAADHLLVGPVALSVAVVATAVITFYGFLWYGAQQDRNQELKQGDIRTAITVSIVTVYLVVFGLVAFFAPPEPGTNLRPITESMLQSFTATVAVIVPFSFATTAYVETRNGPTEETGEPPPEPPPGRSSRE